MKNSILTTAGTLVLLCTTLFTLAQDTYLPEGAGTVILTEEQATARSFYTDNLPAFGENHKAYNRSENFSDRRKRKSPTDKNARTTAEQRKSSRFGVKRNDETIILGESRNVYRFGFAKGRTSGTEIARVINTDGKKIALTSTSVYFKCLKDKPVNFDVNIYLLDKETGLPAGSLLPAPIPLHTTEREGWLTADLSAFDLVTDQPVAIAFCWKDADTFHPAVAIRSGESLIKTGNDINWEKYSDLLGWLIKAEAYELK